MVKISAIEPYIPKRPKEFCTNPYDVIGPEEESKLKENPESLIHLILPDGNGEEVYINAKKAFNYLKESNAIVKVEKPSIFVYRQESSKFSHQGFILGTWLKDYDDGTGLIRNEHTRKKPLADRTKHISATHAATGLVWNTYRADEEIRLLMEKIKQKDPIFDFKKYGYRQIIWQETDAKIINKLKKLFKNVKLYIADGHHRTASANEYRKMKIKDGEVPSGEQPWQYLLNYVSSDDQINLMPYNRVIRKLDISAEEFLNKIGEIYGVSPKDVAFKPSKKHEVAMCLEGQWFKLTVKQNEFKSVRDGLDVAILQDKVFNPILGIEDPRSHTNLFFVGGLEDPKEMEKYIVEKGNDVFFSLYAVDIHDLEAIGDVNGIMPPKSTWFDPKLLSGITILGLEG